MAVFNATNPVVVGGATKKDDYDRVFDNTLELRTGGLALASAVAGDDVYVSTTTQLARRDGRRQLRQSFRGLRLRTHPDADKAAAQIYLDRADEVILDDGQAVVDWDDLSADISVAGAGGLDTGAEAASAWYEIYGIRKSSDGTKNLLLHRAIEHFLDESQTTVDTGWGLRVTASQQLFVAQTFDTDEAGKIPFADVTLYRTGAPVGQVWAELRATAAGLPTGAALATSDKIDVNAINTSTTGQVTRFVFRSPLTVVAGTTYALVVNANYAVSAVDRIVVRSNTAGGYAAGTLKHYDGTTWNSSTDDLYFRIYVTTQTAAVTMPADYDQRCLIGYVYNNSSSNFVGFLQHDRQVRRVNGAAAVNLAATIPTLVDMAALVPPVPVNVSQMQVINNSSGSVNYAYATLDSIVDGKGLFYWQSPAGNYVHDVGLVFPTELQHAYLSVTGGSLGTWYVGGFTW